MMSLFLIIPLIVLFAFFGYRMSDNVVLPIKIFPTPTEIPKKTVTHVYVPVVHIASPLSNISSDEVKASQNLLTINDNVDIFLDGYQADVVAKEDLSNALEDNKIAILTLDQIEPNFKILNLDNQNPLENLESEDYPLKYIEVRLGESGEETNYDSNKLLTIFAGGEIIPARAVDRLSLNINNNYTYLFDDVAVDIQSADVAIAQLENPVLGDPAPCTGCTVFVSDERVIKGLKTVGFDIIAASGNHMGDGGQEGYARTAEVFKENKLKYTGMGKGDKELLKPAIVEVDGIKVGMLSADDVAYLYWSLNDSDVYSTNRFSNLDGSSVVPDHVRIRMIEEIKEDNQIDFFVIYMSWGVEYTNEANEHQQELARSFIDNGADLILASHPHWVQNIEIYKGKPIFYSLGNFIFDQTHTLETRQSYVANLAFYDGKIINTEIIPLQTCGYHQTSNNLTNQYLTQKKKLMLMDLTKESEGCIYWMPRKVSEDTPQYEQIINRILQNSEFEVD